ncbi:cytochrome b [Comamonas composti]|uniref:cytochrome b n=1 Tax=Comamonas composti TaxID=408558 RepID=UPI001FE00B1F|nr:cytochrome b [Comamonas composti]
MSSTHVSAHMAAASPARRYTGTAMAAHWLLAIGLLSAIGLGWYMTGLPFSPARLKLYNWHKWLGVSLLALSLLRLLWRLGHKPPPLPAKISEAMPAWQRLAHHATQHAMYLLFFAVPLLGWAYSSAAGFPIVFLGQIPLPDFVSPSAELAEAIKPWHGASAWALTALIAVHVGAALKHQFLDRDGLISRMLPGRG